MEKTLRRFFTNSDGKYVCEHITWLLAGTNCVPMNSELCVSIGVLVKHPRTQMMVDSWQPIVIINAAFDIPQQDVITAEDERVNMSGEIETYDKVVQIVMSPVIDCYNLPLKSGWVEVTKGEYNQTISSFK